MTPLQLTGKLNKVDIHATITDGGPSGQAGAVRLAVSRALQSFVEPDMVEQMRLGGFSDKNLQKMWYLLSVADTLLIWWCPEPRGPFYLRLGHG